METGHPIFFPFDDAEASYTIVKENDNYQLHYLTSSDRNKSYQCSYERNGEKNCGEVLNNDIKVLIGKSDTELEPFLNKKVKINGDFDFDTQQCIAGQCKYIGNILVLNLKSIEDLE